LLSRVTLVALAALVATALAGAAGCSASARTPDFSTPNATLETFFVSAQLLDYRTTYSCYHQAYREAVSEQEFIKRRSEGASLKSHRIDSLTVNGSSAVATVTLAFAPAQAPGATPRTVQTQEHLVKQAGSWKVQVW
jgi:hypothetical protein